MMTIKRILAFTLLLAFASITSANCLPEDATPADVRSVLECQLGEPTANTAPARTDQLAFWRQQATSFEELAGTYESSGQRSLQVLSNNLKTRAELAAADMSKFEQTGDVCNVAAYKDNTWFWGAGLRLNRVNSRTDLQAPTMAGCAGTPEIPAMSLVDQVQESCESAESCNQGLAAVEPLTMALRSTRAVARLNSESALTTLQQQITEKDEAWDRYLFESKPLWPWELAFTDWWHDRYDDTYAQGFRRPPPKQIILMHPSIGAEWIDNATDGDRFAPTIYVEIVGVNYWDDTNRWFRDSWLSSLSGASLAVTVTDRPGINTVGAGPLLTFDNTFEVGINYYGEGEFGVMVGINLMKLWKGDYEKRVNRLKNAGR
ncbi:hypothetical protein QPM17_20855 [Marinobacter sp. TBZ242]|uniref:Lysozyme inhibitor LprI N-terminal domain-containing protein n=1 Tax=Marinobacter azerbaijanicus TaxID=3050455 RepID=A0ABT7IHE5_9GAMM|nr:hypothetical protein [Marinobacter sp. TBZ242]MDL0433598.1 hypothetical protein [Marinobacter sp. TBZ242]